MKQNVFSRNLKFFRQNRELTQTDLGNISGLGQVTIANYEAARRFPNEHVLNILAKSLNIQMNLFFIDQDIKLPKKTEVIFNIDKFIQLLIDNSIDDCFLYINSWKESLGYNLKQTFNHIIITTLKEVGLRWEKGILLVSQEHIISQKIRSLITLISNREFSLSLVPLKKELVWVGFCAPNDKHDMVLFMTAQIARLRGWQVYFIGADVPLLDLIKAIKIYKPILIYISISMEEFQIGLTEYLTEIKKLIKNKLLIFIGGNGCNINYISSHNCVKGFIKTFNQGCQKLIKIEENL